MEIVTRVVDNSLIKHKPSLVYFCHFLNAIDWEESEKSLVTVELLLFQHSIEPSKKNPENSNKDLSLTRILGLEGENLLQLIFEVLEFKAINLKVNQLRGKDKLFEIHIAAFTNREGKVTGFSVSKNDITDEVEAGEILNFERRILEKVSQGEDQKKIFDIICEGIEAMVPGVMCTISEVGKDKKLHIYAARGVPKEYYFAIEGAENSIHAISYGASAYPKDAIVIEDILNNELWENYKHVAAIIGFKSCTSTPVVDFNNSIIATCSIYYKEKRKPSAFELELVRAAGNVVQLVIEKNKTFIELERQKRIYDKNEEFYKSIIDSSGDLIRIVDAEGIIKYCSLSVREILGYEPEELVGKSAFEYLHKEDIAMAQGLIEYLSEQKHIPKVESRWLHKDGHYVFLESLIATKIRSGSKQEYLFNCRDISQRKLYEKQLKDAQEKVAKSEAWFKKLAKIIPDYIIIWDLATKKPFYFNQIEIFGYNLVEDFAQFSTLAIFHKDDRYKIQELRKQLAANQYKNIRDFDFKVRLKNGNWGCFLSRFTIMERDEDGLPTLLLNTITDITERYKHEVFIEKTKNRVLSLIENTKDSIWSINEHFQLTAFNSQFKKNYFNEYNREPRIGESVFFSSTGDEIEQWKPLYERALSGERFVDTFIIKKGDKTMFFEGWFNPIFSKKGLVEGVCCYYSDFTQRKRIEEDLKHANTELDGFVYRASHDMMAPLRSVLGLVNLLRIEKDSVTHDMYLNLIDQSVKKLDTFIKDLTAFSRNTKKNVDYSEINFQILVEACVQDLLFMDNADKIEITIEVNQTSRFISDEGRINVILHNLISNAIKYQRWNIENPWLKIKIEANEFEAIVEVADNGRGIHEEYLEKIFEMFFRAAEDSFGSGIGLYIVKQVIEKLQGKIIEVKSKLGEGTILKISIPNHKEI